MKLSVLKRLAAVSLYLFVAQVFADDELVVYTFKSGVEPKKLSVKLDGGEPKTLRRDGSVYFDLSGGTHSMQVLEDGEPVHAFRFDSADGQYTDISIVLGVGRPKVSIENYYRTEGIKDRLEASEGGVEGKVSSLGVPVRGAIITVQGSDVTATTDGSGEYELELPRGFYNLEITHPDFGTREINNFRIVSNVERVRNFTVSQDLGNIEELVVLGTYRPGGFELDERDTTNVVDTLGIEQLARFGDSDVAGSVIRVPSVTVQDGQFVFIRGLGGRYITTTLNGATMPSTDPAKRTVPLDLFPSNIVSQLDVKKTFISPMPGESTGGNLVINTRTFPDDRAGKISISVAGNSGFTGDTVFADPSEGDFDFLGWDDGTREEPISVSAIADVLSLGSITDSSSGQTFVLDDRIENELRRLGGLLIQDDFDLGTATATPNVSIGANFGDLFYIGESDLGVFAALNYKNGWSQRDDGVSNTFSASGDPRNRFAFKEYANDIDVSGLLSVGRNVGNNTFEADTILSRSTQSKVRRTVGEEGDEFQAQIRHTTEWVERMFISQQFTGTHFLNEEGSLLLDWQITASQATRLAPDRREVIFNADGAITDAIALRDTFDLDAINQSLELDGFFLEANELLRRYDELTDNNLDISAEVTYELFADSNSEANLEFGFQIIKRERDSDSSSYGFNIQQGLVEFIQAPNVLVTDVINQDSITGENNTGFEFVDRTQASDSYEAEMDLNSVYLSYDHLFNTNYQVIVGVRYEDYEQITDTFELITGLPADNDPIDEGVFLPSIGFNWFYREDQQLRLAAYKTVSRPDFKETSNAVFFDTEFDRRERGNPELDVSEVVNFDLRWEWYFSDSESLSVAAFYKDFEDPIEHVAQPGSGSAGGTRTFRNSESAELYGVEVEGRFEFALNSDLTKSIFVSINGSYIESEVDDRDGKRALQGQPDYTANLIVGYDDIENNHEFTILINQNGESIKDVGDFDLPDLIEESRLDVKINYKYLVNDNFVVKASVENLFDDEFEFTEGGRVFQSYTKGVEFQLGIDWSF